MEVTLGGKLSENSLKFLEAPTRAFKKNCIAAYEEKWVEISPSKVQSEWKIPKNSIKTQINSFRMADRGFDVYNDPSARIAYDVLEQQLKAL